MAELIATGTTDANSADVVVAAGSTVSVALFDADGAAIDPGCRAHVQYKASNGQYFDLAVLDRSRPMVLVDGPVTFRVVRKASSKSFGVDQS